jgi:hypothetical protein
MNNKGHIYISEGREVEVFEKRRIFDAIVVVLLLCCCCLNNHILDPATPINNLTTYNSSDFQP